MDHQSRHSSIDAETVDELLSLLADQRCRSTLSYFRDASTGVASLHDIASELAGRDDGETERTALQLHHSVLPRLADVGAVDYDAQSNTARYRGHSELETLLDAVTQQADAEL